MGATQHTMLPTTLHGNVLVVDDQRTFARSTQAYVVHAKSVEHAVDALLHGKFDAVLLDYDLSFTALNENTEPIARLLGANPGLAKSVLIISDLDFGRKRLAELLAGHPRVEMSTLGYEWNAAHLDIAM
jgi:hypothetical protein